MNAPKLPRFDYRAAGAELARPIMDALPANVLELYHRLRDAEDFDGLCQGPDLSIRMPEALRADFEAIDSATLALAARAIHCTGHWGTLAKRDNRGAFWKFANLADGVLARRLGLPRGSGGTSRGWTLCVLDGALRLGALSRDMGTWAEIGPATADFLEHVHALALPAYAPGEDWQDAAYAVIEGLARNTADPAEHPALPVSADWAALLSAGSAYMRAPGEASDDCTECGKQRLFGDSLLDHAHTCTRYPAVRLALADALKALGKAKAEAERRGLDFAPIYTAIQALEPWADGNLLPCPRLEAMPRTAANALPGDNL